MSDETRDVDLEDMDLEDLKEIDGGMKVVLLRDLRGIGCAGDVVEVSNGKALYQLIPKGWAVEAPF